MEIKRRTIKESMQGKRKELKKHRSYKLPSFFRNLLIYGTTAVLLLYSAYQTAYQIPLIARRIDYGIYSLAAANYIATSLPNVSEFYQQADEYDVDLRYSLFNDRIARLIPPPEGKNYLININFETDEEQRKAISDAFDEYNQIFSIINPNYYFKVNFSPTKLDMNNLHCVTVNISERDGNILGTTYLFRDLTRNNSYLNSARPRGIQLDPTVLHRPRVLKSVMQHEFGHLLGLHDDYLLKEPFVNTIMSTINFSIPISQNDLMILDCLYRNPENILSDAEIKSALHDLSFDMLAKRYNINLEMLEKEPTINEFQEKFGNWEIFWRNGEIETLGDENLYSINYNQHESCLYSWRGNTFWAQRYNDQFIENDPFQRVIHRLDDLRFVLTDNTVYKFYSVGKHIFMYTTFKEQGETVSSLNYLGSRVSEEEFLTEKEYFENQLLENEFLKLEDDNEKVIKQELSDEQI